MNVAYVAKRFVRRQIPDDWAFTLLRLRGHDNAAEAAPDRAWQKRKRQLDEVGIDIAGRHIAEMGSGRYARLALQMLRSRAACVTLVDLYATDVNDREHKALLMDDCAQLGLGWDDMATRVRVLTGDMTSLPIPAVEARPDIVISSAVLEHTVDPERALVACWEWLRPGGQTSHVIDLRDHVFESPFEMLAYSARAWQRWLCPKRGFHLNRWRLPEYLDAMDALGFVNIGYQVLERDEAGLREIMPRLDERFKDIRPDMLSVLVVHVYGEKPILGGANDPR